jgi:serine/threonine protein kinase
MDTEEGIVPNKIHKIALPVIVMEFLEGGEMFDRIQERKSVSEMYISAVFKDIMTGLQGLHGKGYLHRDLKLENLMLVNTNPQSPVKIIDFGMMVEMNPKLQIYKSKGVQGTRGYVAPESLTRSEYSPKTDVFQAGCTLYALLSGFQPFNPARMDQVINGKYFQMKGPGWDNISQSAKELVAGMLAKDPAQRLSVAEVLAHPWLHTSTSDMDMGDAYYDRIKNLVLKQKMKDFFLDHDISEGNKTRKAKLKAIVPYLAKHHRATTRNKLEEEENAAAEEVKNAESISAGQEAEDFDDKIRHLRDVMIRSYSIGSEHMASPDEVRKDGSKSDLVKLRRASETKQMSVLKFADFKRILNECDLPELANRQVFRIFDIGKNGEIDLKEFLVTLVAFRDGDEEDEDENDATARFYFNMFDINDSGFIDLEELKLAVQCILLDDNNPRYMNSFKHGESDVESLFRAMDMSSDGKIDFDEFRAFYSTIMIQSSPRCMGDYEDDGMH